MAVHFDNLAELIYKFKEAGNHWFDHDTMRFFDSRVHNTVYGGRVFVSSERQDDEHPRTYTVRIVTQGDNGAYGVESVGLRASLDRDEAHHVASVIGALNDSGFIPDTFEYGQDVALARFFNIDDQNNDGGWYFGKPSGFAKR